jgi:hypothetical protein
VKNREHRRTGNNNDLSFLEFFVDKFEKVPEPQCRLMADGNKSFTKICRILRSGCKNKDLLFF